MEAYDAMAGISFPLGVSPYAGRVGPVTDTWIALDDPRRDERVPLNLKPVSANLDGPRAGGGASHCG
jgi:hypothetical protein